MGQNVSPDRHLQKRSDGGYRYVRRVPTDVLTEIHKFQPNHPTHVRISLRTASLEEAREKRNAIEEADDNYWTSCVTGGSPSAREVYDRAVTRARHLRLEYRTATDLAANADVDELVRRILMIPGRERDQLSIQALLGGVAEPEQTTSLDDAFDVFMNVIRKREYARKSDNQKRKWKELKLRGISNFKKIVGDIPLERISRDHARQFFQHWLSRIEPDSSDQKALSASAGNKDLGTMRALYGEYMDHIGRDDMNNPFRRLRFEDRNDNNRPPFSEAWIKTRLLARGVLDGLNTEARLAVLTLINTGARPSEIVNLDAEAIVLDKAIPFIDIRETSGRQLKARSTRRRIPLAGVSLEAMRQAPNGFPRYRDRDTLSANVNKYLRNHNLMESPAHTLYSLRHGFEARLKSAEADDELRRYLMGHKIDRPKYGYGDDLSWVLSGVEKVAL